MRCSGCDKPLTTGVVVCLYCGTPVPEGLESSRVAVATDHRPAPVPLSGEHWRQPNALASPYLREVTSLTPPPPPLYLGTHYAETTYPISVPKRNGARRWVLLAVLLAVLSLGFIGAYRFALAHGVVGSGVKSIGDGAVSGQPAPVIHNYCAPTHNDSNPLPIIQNAQLTDGVRDVQSGDYTPIDLATTFQVGKSAYMTFVVAAISTSGTLSAYWCQANGAVIAYRQIIVSPAQAGDKGYFSVNNIDPANVGNAHIILWWQPVAVDGTIHETAILSLPFTIVPATSTKH